MILIAIIASALAAGMFWSPNFDKRPEGRKPESVEDGNPIAEARLEDKTICIHLGELDLEQLGQLERLYHDTPLYPIISGYRDEVQEALKAEIQKAKRIKYVGQLNSKGYQNELLAHLDTDTLERIIKDLE
jgi:hypothetical protein